MPIRTTLMALLAAALTASRADAQACIGAASFSAGTGRIGAGADFTDGAKSYGIQLAIGSLGSAFATAALSTVQYDNVDEDGTVVSLAGGYAIPTGASKQGSFCPMVGFAHQTGPNFSTSFGTVEVSEQAFSFGGAFGGVASSTPTMDFVPFVSAVYVTEKATASLSGSSASSSKDFSVITVGAGFVVNRNLTIRPELSLPVGLSGGKASYGIGFAFSFGSPPASADLTR